jgi:epoxide hydrolase-like predicted phosphatase
MSDAPRSALLVDWGGVLTTDLFASFRAFCDENGLDPEAIGTAFRSDPEAQRLLFDLECGRIGEADFEPFFGELLGVPGDGLIDGLFRRIEPDHLMIDAVRRARQAGIPTGLVSNSWGTRRYPQDLLDELFDGVVISGHEGMRKPAPEIYVLGAERAGVEATACVFVDDLHFNLDPARELGMEAIHHTDTHQTVAELERLLGLALR